MIDSPDQIVDDPEIADPFEILEAHRITSSLVRPRHVCSCGEVFDIDVASEDRFAETGKHIGAVMDAAEGRCQEHGVA